MTLDRLQSAMSEVMSLLAAGAYKDLIARCATSRLSPADVRMVLEEYGRNVVVPPQEAYALLNAVEVEGAAIPTWSASMPLWTEQEGRSDLTVELTIMLGVGEAVVELDDIHVL